MTLHLHSCFYAPRPADWPAAEIVVCFDVLEDCLSVTKCLVENRCARIAVKEGNVK